MRWLSITCPCDASTVFESANRGADLNRFSKGAQFQGEVDFRALIHDQFHAVTHHWSKALVLYAHLITARRQHRDSVQPDLVGLDLTLRAGGNVAGTVRLAPGTTAPAASVMPAAQLSCLGKSAGGQQQGSDNDSRQP